MSYVLEGMDGIAPADIAERWFVRLMSPDCTAREREKFEAWLGQSPENALAFEDAKALWAGLEDLGEDEILAPHVAAALQADSDIFMGQWTTATECMRRREPATPRPRRWRVVGAMAAGLAAVLVAGVSLWPALQPDVPAVEYTANDRIESVQLADGSAVRLDLDTAIDARIGQRKRDIALHHGRAMFDVAKDASRPFVVDAGVGTITALGTHFQVQREGELVSVALLEGSVGITTAGSGKPPRMLRLSPGQKASYTPETRSWAVESIDAEAATSWSQGFHIFAATPLRQAVAEINRYSTVKLTLADPAVGALQVSGSFKLGDGQAIADALPYALPVKANAQAGHIVISRR